MDESEAAFPDVFRPCVVTWARTRAQLDEKCDETLPWDWPMGDLPWSICSRDLVKEQKLDPSWAC